jgi:hypothetical protein
VTEREVHSALTEFEELWNELFPAEQARIVELLVQRVDVQPDHLDITLKIEGLTSLHGELRSQLRTTRGRRMMPPKTITVGKVKDLKLSRDGRTMVISIPISMRRTGGRKTFVTPANAAPWSPPPARVDNTIVKALARAHRWREMLESNLFATVRDLSKAEKINEAYLCRVLRLTLLSPKITETILSGQLTDGIDLAKLLKPFPIEWEKQQDFFQIRQASQ